ncbi:hypothetical protein LOTGIDRAFT_164509 [Lottia gigantea]|uniref:CDV3 homolog n=1 Tax=Lottia gigantea TaxID=225164 RepID=V3ZG49_LOTGI|nr:hypothetical protein LOTGIDRAFT_164509 [Lottia gigantea]ESO90193.1 hypothetical protein LOTGIDRAFT_164509 [Lottia gigantea]
MADDNSLDDFFAKKDKSKKKSKSKMTTTTSELLSQMEENHAKKQRQKREKETEKQAGLSDRLSDDLKGTKQKESEDWQDFEDEQEKDYSGLRIQTLQIGKEGNEEQDEEEEEEKEEVESESKTTRDLSQGPWKQSTPAPAPVQEPEKPKDETPKTTGKYIPPSLRGGPSSSAASTPSRRPMGKKSAPNITSEMDFPSLGGNKAPVVQNNSESIENPNQRGKLNLTLGNKFSALQN